MMKCRNCGHPRESHHERTCRMKIATGWSEETQSFGHYEDCGCPGYSGPAPVDASPATCPHELQTEGEHPNKCVHCGKTVPTKSGKGR